ncbi:hypothetical protein GGTG_13363 [Gaeumannomyces tritici R3-111a-1]|uniref:Uncharacterized protein n=1 Tax=Gaeumannomyces tritici (strain R3-111a-1) TaxID=644352 RepID=J3PIN4_GAET3|nr:hypothetical protein GGTG_13363 [Gaeumannomyces tritici R3-111a-1]EJT69095.1 hypothetical protein GGTG_13363 [Gaeumannomyces tritici R3-111a-1]
MKNQIARFEDGFAKQTEMLKAQPNLGPGGIRTEPLGAVDPGTAASLEIMCMHDDRGAFLDFPPGLMHQVSLSPWSLPTPPTGSFTLEASSVPPAYLNSSRDLLSPPPSDIAESNAFNIFSLVSAVPCAPTDE